MKPFYNNKIAAAWMAQAFGMRFILEDGAEVFNLGCGMATAPGPLIGAVWHDGPYYVHPDSLHILEPRVGDIVLNCDDDPARVVEDDAPPFIYTVPLKTAKEFVGKEAVIIQRDGKPFHWPDGGMEP